MVELTELQTVVLVVWQTQRLVQELAEQVVEQLVEQLSMQRAVLRCFELRCCPHYLELHYSEHFPQAFLPLRRSASQCSKFSRLFLVHSEAAALQFQHGESQLLFQLEADASVRSW